MEHFLGLAEVVGHRSISCWFQRVYGLVAGQLYRCRPSFAFHASWPLLVTSLSAVSGRWLIFTCSRTGARFAYWDHSWNRTRSHQWDECCPTTFEFLLLRHRCQFLACKSRLISIEVPRIRLVSSRWRDPSKSLRALVFKVSFPD